ncbi:hypothetical protein B0I35DRAFT_360567 [Stachybotrys elegans]|uniref:Protein kinase domain-containing protein n=1 Tax=Stachybotrys elegans TaxID=80388 RepID=A0A8K0WL15_9HYPO|nr:hypothetical protein B0I35DRAFT_360567 [Stachybotrys elegans]
MSTAHWTWSQLRGWLRQTNRDVTHLNPLVKRLLVHNYGARVLGIGARSIVIAISEGLAAKVPLVSEDRYFAREQAICEQIDTVQSAVIPLTFLMHPDITFLEAAVGTLHERITGRHPRDVAHWMLQLTNAAAALESLGLAHAHINPHNVLFDANDQIKLVDFDKALPIGANLDSGDLPYVRRNTDPRKGGRFGRAGAATEQFALASIFYYMDRGTEVFANMSEEARECVMLEGTMPSLESSTRIDHVVENCWEGRYLTLESLSEHIFCYLLNSDPPHIKYLSPEERAHFTERAERAMAGLETPCPTCNSTTANDYQAPCVCEDDED